MQNSIDVVVGVDCSLNKCVGVCGNGKLQLNLTFFRLFANFVSFTVS